MVKGPDLLGGLLDKKADRRKVLKIAGFTGALAALAACSGGNKPTSPSTMETVSTQPTPTPAETTQPAVELPDPAELISDEKIEKASTFPNWQTLADDVKARGDGEKAIGDDIAVASTEILNFITNALLSVDEATVQQIRQQVNAIKDEKQRSEQIAEFASKLQDHVTRKFVETSIVDPTKGYIPRFIEWINLRGRNNTELTLSTCGFKGALTEGDRFYRTGELVTYASGHSTEYTEYPGSNRIIRDVFHWTTDTNLSPEICQADYEILHPDQDKLEIQLDFEPPKKGNYDEPMRIVDASTRRYEE
jgi:hypothetical protein